MPPRLLVVEDEAPVQELLAEYLRGRGFSVTTSNDGAAAKAALAAGPYDLMITDLKLPDTEGVSLVRVAAACTPPVPSLVMSGYASVEAAVEAITAGAVDVLLKPFRLKGAHAAVERALTHVARRAHDARRIALADWYEALTRADTPADVEACAATLPALGLPDEPSRATAARALAQARARCGS